MENVHRNRPVGGGDSGRQSQWKMIDSCINQFTIEEYEVAN